jgi:hypothetical protein
VSAVILLLRMDRRLFNDAVPTAGVVHHRIYTTMLAFLRICKV